MQEDLKEIAGLDLTVEEGNAPASSNDIYIESQTMIHTSGMKLSVKELI